jgi:SNF2 family DNA or RNA helicase
MHILHGTWHPDIARFVLWGEDIPAAPRYTGGRRARFAAHPFALTHAQLFYYLDRFTSEHSAPDGQPVVIWLPGRGKKPQPSPEAIAAGMDPLPDKDLSLLAWEIRETITLSPIDTLDLLYRLPLPHERSTGFILGSDLAYWQQAALLTTNCLIEQRYIPALKQQGARYLVYWQPRPDPDLRDQLTAHMPSLCRAITADYSAAPASDAMLDNFLQNTLDAFVRDVYNAQPPRSLVWHRWLAALTDRYDSTISGAPRENRQLYEAWENWQAAWDGIGPGTFRVCFRLDEPAGDDDQWPLDYLLQATDDPSLLVEAGVVWRSTGQTLNYLERRFDQPHEKLLAALGLASSIFDPIEWSLREPDPTGVVLSREDAYRFLADALPLLEEQNFGVLVPNWWRRAVRLRAKATLNSESEVSTGLLSKDSLVSYQWQLSLGGETIGRAEFEQLVALKQPMVRFRDEWVALDAEQVEAALKFFDKQKDAGELNLLDALKLTGGADAPDGLEVEDVEIHGWLNGFFKQLQKPDAASIPPIPEGLRATLRPYQQRGFGWLVQMRQMGLGACLADDMGLGKTIQAITLWLHEREQHDVTRPALVVCPTSVVGNWRHEIGRFAPALRVMTHHGSDRQRDDAFAEAAAGVDVVLTNYALLSRDRATLAQVHWSSVTLDEAQNIKNPSTKQAQAARALKADYRLALTGTPIENRLSELWSIFQFLNPGYLGSRKAFRTRFSIPIERYNDENSAATLKQLTRPFILRRVKTDPNVINDLPDKFENKIYCTLSPEQATLYEAVVREEMNMVETAASAMQRRGSVLRMLTHLKQICNHPAHFLKESTDGVEAMKNRSGKLSRLTEMLEEVYANDECTLIFTQYAQMGKILRDYLSALFADEVLFLHGGTPAKQRAEMIRRFQAPRGPAIFVLSLKAGGTGLNLTRATHVFHFDRWYNPAVENQATDRAYRIGQTDNVQVHKLLCLGTLEERIDELIEHKQALADQIVGGGEQWLSEMGTDELRDLVTLRRDALE